MPSSNPFDFSDFGGYSPSAPAPRSQPGALPSQGPTAAASSPGAQPEPDLPTGGFDPFASQPPVEHSSAAPDEVFGGPAGRAQMRSLAVAGPPLALFTAAFAVAVIGVVLGIVAASTGSMVLLAFAGWLLAGPAAIGALAWFSSIDTRRRLSSVYSAPTWLSTAYWVVVGTCAVGIGIDAWQIALWAGRQ